MNKIKIFFSISIYCLFAFLGANPARAAEANLLLSPASGNYTVNKNFNVAVMVNSGDVADGVNAAEGVVKFDPDFLAVSKISDAGSIFKLWTTEPTYSNTNGTITFGGGSPGAYKGGGGQIFSVTFTAKQAGETSVSFNSGIILAADGKGTDVSGGFGNANFVIEEAAPAEDKPKPKTDEKPKDEVKGILPPLPDISSKTHPEDDVWYSDNSPSFSWKVLSDLTGVSYSITKEAASDPGPENDGIVETADFENLEDGAWYFHIKYQNRYGWGQIAHKKFMIDSTPPEGFSISVDNGGDPTDPAPRLRFKTEDLTSGLSYYTLETKGAKVQISAEEMEKGYYQMDIMPPAEYTSYIAAYDMAGNAASSSKKYMIEPLESPIITDIPKILNKNEKLIIRGTSFYPRVTVKIFVKNGEDIQEFNTITDDNNNWSYFHETGLDKGNYEVYARIIDSRGAQSLDSSRQLLTVVSPSLLEAYGWLIILILLMIIAGLILYILYQQKRFKEEEGRIRLETYEVKAKLSKIFAALREEVDELIELSDKRPGLSDSERKVKERLQESLDISEEFITKEVEDVEKEIKLKKKSET